MRHVVGVKELLILAAGTVVLFAIPPLSGRLGEALAKRRAASAKRSGATQVDALATPAETPKRRPMNIPRFRSNQPQTKTLENLT